MIEYNEQCRKCFHFQVCASVLKEDLFIREVVCGEKNPKCKQFVEVVKCKDCVHWNKDALSCDTLPYESSYEHANWYADDFCSYGERRTDV